MKKSRNSDKLFPLYKHPTDALPAPNGADFGVWGALPSTSIFRKCLDTCIACHLAEPPKSTPKTRKTKALLHDLRFSGFL